MIEIRCDKRLSTLASVLTTCKPLPETPQRALVLDTKKRLSKISHHPSCQWVVNAEKNVSLLGLAMQAVQVNGPPDFSPAPMDEVPWYVKAYFSQVSAEELGHHLGAIWQDANLEQLFIAQEPLWEEAETDLSKALGEVEVGVFQEQFFGINPYHLVAVPLANLSIEGWRAVGVANLRETYATFFSNEPYQSYGMDLIGLAQHEASHPILSDIERKYPNIAAQCVFVEEAFPPTDRFAHEYGDSGYRWTEMVIRASTYFFFTFLGRNEQADRYLREEITSGVKAIEVFVEALNPWWQERQSGKASGLDQVLDQLPLWLKRTVSKRVT